MQPRFLERINDRLNDGYRAIQGQRSYKNWDSPMGALDGLSEIVNTHILCKGHAVLGLSARLAGSGMAFEYDLFKDVMEEIDAIGGFDKEMELLHFIRQNFDAKTIEIRVDANGAFKLNEALSK